MREAGERSHQPLSTPQLAARVPSGSSIFPLFIDVPPMSNAKDEHLPFQDGEDHAIVPGAVLAQSRELAH